ncbi:Smr/MutS family protein [Sphingomonas sp. BT-65]|uniref:Smr/MutS family protein n=1 Tax=Sphingomonas sp. BT-65 TaxID=2989821 RepID=UPI002235F98B|nr:Smr/MutS family protein [Sphingomonas sp. BT-65]MCW4461219.1 Smr/MutS family protein [Sphingomonas sp. BT-65]
MMTPEERALWARVIATVTPIERERVPTKAPAPKAPAPVPPEATPMARAKGRVPPAPSTKPKPAPPPADTLDAGWDRRLSRGLVAPESTIDLHGHTLATAHARLDLGLEMAIARGDRVLLLITGKPPRPESERPHARGAIRAAVGDWITASRHADRIAAVRNAHPRHGGHGALYIVLKRQRNAGARNS